MEAFTNFINPNLDKLVSQLTSIQINIQKYLEKISDINDPKLFKEMENSNYYKKLDKYVNNNIPIIIEDLQECSDLLYNQTFFNSLSIQLEHILGQINRLIYSNYNFDQIQDVLNVVRRVNLISDELVLIRASSDRTTELIDKAVEEAKNKLNYKLGEIDAVKKVLEGQKTEDIYSKAHEEYKEDAVFFECWFYLVTFIGGMSVICTLVFPDFRPNELYDLITIRVIIFSLTITLATLFLRKSSHLRKLSDQAKQTSLELQALPTFITELDKEDQRAIYKELASKYFGKELDQTQNDKVGDLMKDQLVAGTELIKASAELVKVKGNSTPPQ